MATNINPLYVRDNVGSLLNNTGSLSDPYKQGDTDFTRPGNNPDHFITKQLNLARRDTFPKGYIRINSTPLDDPISFGAPRVREREVMLDIYYYVVRNTTGSNITEQNEDFVELMLENIKDTIELGFKGLTLTRPRFGEISNIEQIKEGNIPLFVGLIPVTFRWTHGQVS